MIDWLQIDYRLSKIGKDRAWLSEQTGYSADTIRTALAPASVKRSDRMQSAITRAIEDEESRHHQTGGEIAPGIFEIFLTAESLDKADRASRIVQAPSLAEFCPDVIDEAATRILAEESEAGSHHSLNPEKNGETAA